MTFTLAQLKNRAAAAGAELIVLSRNGALPPSLRGKTGRELWLCVPVGTDEKRVYAAAARFGKIHVFRGREEKR